MKNSTIRLSVAPKNLTKRVVRKMQRLKKSLGEVMPEASTDFVIGIAKDLADFWEIGEEHRFRVAAVEKLKGTRDRRKLAKLLTDLLYRDLLAHLPYHLRRMRRILPPVIDSLERRPSKRRK